MANNNLSIYEAFRRVPEEAKKQIKGGRINGFTDINPMWRLKMLTEQFGPCGVGWKYEITKQWTELGANDEASAFCNINLYIKTDGEWSEGIPGTGGSAFVAKERGGLYTSDECYKMALTDALSVSCKALGLGADVYWQRGESKYDKAPPPEPEKFLCEKCGEEFQPFTLGGKQYTARDAYLNAKKKRGAALCKACYQKAQQAAQESDDLPEDLPFPEADNQ